MNYRILLVILLFISAFLVLAHQALTSCSGEMFQLSDFLHHENIAVMITAFACGILFSVETKRLTK